MGIPSGTYTNLLSPWHDTSSSTEHKDFTEAMQSRVQAGSQTKLLGRAGLFGTRDVSARAALQIDSHKGKAPAGKSGSQPCVVLLPFLSLSPTNVASTPELPPVTSPSARIADWLHTLDLE